jgi:hypothetical protein
LPKLRLEGLRVTAGAGAIPVPERLTLWGLPAASSLMATLALSLPVVEGVKVTVMVQLALAARVPAPTGQVLVWAKSLALVPVSPMLLMVRGAVPLLVSVTLFPALVVPMSWVPNARLVGLRVTAGAVPVPVRATVCGLPLALSVIEREAVSLPLMVGLKVTEMVQLVPAAIVAELPPFRHESVSAKSPALVPVSPMLLMLRSALPLFVKVTVWAALVVPVR